MRELVAVRPLGQLHYSLCMLVLQTTRKTADLLGAPQLQPAPLDLSDSRLGHWTINRVRLGDRSAMFFMNDLTTACFPILEGRKQYTVNDLPPFFAHGVGQLIPLLNLPKAYAGELCDDSNEMILAKATNRSTLGVLNALAGTLHSFIVSAGGMNNVNLSELLVRLNTMPQKTLNWATAKEAIFDALSQRAA